MLCKKCKNNFENKPVSEFYCSKRCRNQVQSSESYYRNREKRLEYSKKEDVKEQIKKLRKTEKYREIRRELMKNKRKNDPMWKLKHNVKDRIRKDTINIFKNISFTEENLCNYLGYTIEDLAKHIFSNIDIEDYLENKYELDHIIPYNRFFMIEIGDVEFKKCWNLRNLRLISKQDNVSRKRINFPWEEIIKYNLIDLLPKGPDKIWEDNKSNFINGTISSTS